MRKQQHLSPQGKVHTEDVAHTKILSSLRPLSLEFQVIPQLLRTSALMAQGPAANSGIILFGLIYRAPVNVPTGRKVRNYRICFLSQFLHIQQPQLPLAVFRKFHSYYRCTEHAQLGVHHGIICVDIEDLRTTLGVLEQTQVVWFSDRYLSLPIKPYHQP